MMGFQKLLQLGSVFKTAGYDLMTDTVEVPCDTAAPSAAAQNRYLHRNHPLYVKILTDLPAKRE
jgi:hypothetical protein